MTIEKYFGIIKNEIINKSFSTNEWNGPFLSWCNKQPNNTDVPVLEMMMERNFITPIAYMETPVVIYDYKTYMAKVCNIPSINDLLNLRLDNILLYRFISHPSYIEWKDNIGNYLETPIFHGPSWQIRYANLDD